MTDLATKAKAAAEHAPVMFHARREHSDSHAALITFEVSLDDMPESVKGAKHGDHFLLVLVPMDREGVEPEILAKTRGEALRVKACVLCGDREFQVWAMRECRRLGGFAETELPTPAMARALILFRCNINSRADLATDPAASDRFEVLIEQFERSRGRRYFREPSDTERKSA